MKFETFKKQSELKTEIEREELKLFNLQRNFSFKRDEILSVGFNFYVKNKGDFGVTEEKNSEVIDRIYQEKVLFIKRQEAKVKRLHRNFEKLK